MKFPYTHRGAQAEIIKDIEESLESGRHIVFEAPTGTGKTVCALYAVLKYAKLHNKKILYLVRTNSQQQQVVKECKNLGAVCVPLQGRANLCPFIRGDSELAQGTPEELARLCSKLKKDVMNGNSKSCLYYSEFLEHSDFTIDYIKEGHTAEEIYRFFVKNGLCPYESIKNALGIGDVVIAPYIYFFSPFIRKSIMDKMGVALRDLIVIVDEAHNLPDFARELRSSELGVIALDRMEKEAVSIGNPAVMGNSLADIAEFLKEAIYDMREYLQNDEDGIVPQFVFEERISEYLGIGINSVREFARELMVYGDIVREHKLKERKLPRSYIYHTGAFIYMWYETRGYEYVKAIRWGENPKLEIICLDPSLTTEILRSVYASVHMSGTLALREYVNLVFLPENTLTRKYPSPFSEENLRVLYVSDVTTKYGEMEKYIPKIATYIDDILSIGRNTVVFFPSYAVMEQVLKNLKTSSFVEKRGIKQTVLFEMLEEFKETGGSIMSVFGGRISEGLDFPGEQLEIVIIVGIPYPKPTAKLRALQMYYESKMGNGWRYVYRIPASIKIRQAIGRLIRKEDDRGVAIILDKRAPQFSTEIRMRETKNPFNDIKRIFEEWERKRGGGASS